MKKYDSKEVPGGYDIFSVRTGKVIGTVRETRAGNFEATNRFGEKKIFIHDWLARLYCYQQKPTKEIQSKLSFVY